MATKIKNVTERLVDGFNDYFNNVESFDGRYVCGQLFLYGKAKAYDVGMPNSYNGEDKVKVNYMLNWFNERWVNAETSLLAMLTKAKKYDGYADSFVRCLGKLTKPISVEQYVRILTSIVEAQQFIRLNKIQGDEYHERITELAVAEITSYHPIDISSMMINLLDTVRERLEKDYDGEHIYPTASLTFLGSTDHLKNDAYSMIQHELSLCVIKVNNLYQFTTDTVIQTFGNMPPKELVDKNIPEALVLGLKNHILLEKSLKHVDNVISVMEEILSTLIEE